MYSKNILKYGITVITVIIPMVSYEGLSGVAHIKQIAHSDNVNLKLIILDNYFHF